MKEKYSENYRRWYDKDPVLSRSMRTLRESDDETQIKVALNLIKIIIEAQYFGKHLFRVETSVCCEDGYNRKRQKRCMI